MPENPPEETESGARPRRRQGGRETQTGTLLDAICGLWRDSLALSPPPVPTPRYIVAGSHREFKDWCRENHLSPHNAHQAVFVRNTECLRALALPDERQIVWVGTAKSRRDYYDIVQAISLARVRAALSPGPQTRQLPSFRSSREDAALIQQGPFSIPRVMRQDTFSSAYQEPGRTWLSCDLTSFSWAENAAPPLSEERQHLRPLVNWYDIGSRDIPIFCPCGHTFTVDVDTPEYPGHAYQCIHCKQFHDLPRWIVFGEGNV